MTTARFLAVPPRLAFSALRADPRPAASAGSCSTEQRSRQPRVVGCGLCAKRSAEGMDSAGLDGVYGSSGRQLHPRVTAGAEALEGMDVARPVLGEDLGQLLLGGEPVDHPVQRLVAERVLP